jgi:hypothetical protein
MENEGWKLLLSFSRPALPSILSQWEGKKPEPSLTVGLLPRRFCLLPSAVCSLGIISAILLEGDGVIVGFVYFVE